MPRPRNQCRGGSATRFSGQPKWEVPQSPKRREEETGAKSAHSALQTGQDVSPPAYLLAQRTAGEDGHGKEDRDTKQGHTQTQGRTSHEAIQEDHAPC